MEMSQLHALAKIAGSKLMALLVMSQPDGQNEVWAPQGLNTAGTLTDLSPSRLSGHFLSMNTRFEYEGGQPQQPQQTNPKVQSSWDSQPAQEPQQTAPTVNQPTDPGVSSTGTPSLRGIDQTQVATIGNVLPQAIQARFVDIGVDPADHHIAKRWKAGKAWVSRWLRLPREMITGSV